MTAGAVPLQTTWYSIRFLFARKKNKIKKKAPKAKELVEDDAFVIYGMRVVSGLVWNGWTRNCLLEGPLRVPRYKNTPGEVERSKRQGKKREERKKKKKKKKKRNRRRKWEESNILILVSFPGESVVVSVGLCINGIEKGMMLRRSGR